MPFSEMVAISQSETSSGPQSSVDDEAHIDDRYSNGIQHPSPPQLPMLVKAPTDSVLHHHSEVVSVLGSPPALSMPFSGNEDFGYIVSTGLVSKSPVRRGGLPSSTTTELLSTRDDDDTKSTATATYLAYHDDDEGDSGVRLEDRVGDPRQASQHATVSNKFWMGGGVAMGGQSERKDEVLSQKREDGIMRKTKRDLATEVKATVVVDEAEVEWDYIVGDRPFAASNGKSNLVALSGPGREGDNRHAIAIVTPDAVSSSEPFNDNKNNNTKSVTTSSSSRYSPPPPSSPPPPPLPPLLSAATTSVAAMPAMTLSTSPVLLEDDDLCGSSTAVAAALAMSSWKQETSELVDEGPSSSSYSSIDRSNRSVLHAVHAVHVDVDDHDNETRRMRMRPTGGRRDHQSSFLAISSSGSSSSSSLSNDDDDDDHYGPPSNSSPSQSQAVVNAPNLRSRITTSSSVGPGTHGDAMKAQRSRKTW